MDAGSRGFGLRFGSWFRASVGVLQGLYWGFRLNSFVCFRAKGLLPTPKSCHFRAAYYDMSFGISLSKYVFWFTVLVRVGYFRLFGF